MTTASELKAMIREEQNEPLDYPRVTGLSAEGLESYNVGFQSTCVIALYDDHRGTWAQECIDHFEKVAFAYSTMGDSYSKGRRAAYDWILGELKSLDEDTVTIPRARYNYLLDLERNAHDFAAKFAEWSES